MRPTRMLRYTLGAIVGGSMMVSAVHPEAGGASFLHGRLVRVDELPPDVCVWPSAVHWSPHTLTRGDPGPAPFAWLARCARSRS